MNSLMHDISEYRAKFDPNVTDDRRSHIFGRDKTDLTIRAGWGYSAKYRYRTKPDPIDRHES